MKLQDLPEDERQDAIIADVATAQINGIRSPQVIKWLRYILAAQLDSWDAEFGPEDLTDV